VQAQFRIALRDFDGAAQLITQSLRLDSTQRSIKLNTILDLVE
jgi:hypothetical protein